MKKFILAMFASLLLAGCGTTYQLSELAPVNKLPEPQSDKAQIVFLKPTKGPMAFISSFIYDITEEQQKLLAVVKTDGKVVVDMKPGEHMLLSASPFAGHVMKINVQAGKRYYVMVRAIYGNGFQLRPLRPVAEDEWGLNNPKFPQWYNETRLMILAPDVEQWQKEYGQTILKEQKKALDIWYAKTDEQRKQLTLNESDYTDVW